ncbi:hypothetical protein ACRAWC_11880 [Leifsonia sp. L25]|uniref:hypothetical protein n=1 Tax=Leifsonia sp. L25 TaxID=3423957 RepID=UPI003D69ABE9
MAAPAGRFPQTYENGPVRKALTALAAEPTMENLETLLTAATTGGLVVDVTGSEPGRCGCGPSSRPRASRCCRCSRR